MAGSWKRVQLEGEQVWSDGESTAWIEKIDGVQMMAVGGADGVAAGYVPLRVLRRIIAAEIRERKAGAGG